MKTVQILLLMLSLSFVACKKKDKKPKEEVSTTSNNTSVTTPTTPAVTYTTIATELAFMDNTSIAGSFSTNGVKKAIVRCGTTVLDSLVGIPYSADPPMGQHCNISTSNRAYKSFKIQVGSTNHIDLYDGTTLIATLSINPANQLPFSNVYLASGVSCPHQASCKNLLAPTR